MDGAVRGDFAGSASARVAVAEGLRPTPPNRYGHEALEADAQRLYPPELADSGPLRGLPWDAPSSVSMQCSAGALHLMSVHGPETVGYTRYMSVAVAIASPFKVEPGYALVTSGQSPVAKTGIRDDLTTWLFNHVVDAYHRPIVQAPSIRALAYHVARGVIFSRVENVLLSQAIQPTIARLTSDEVDELYVEFDHAIDGCGLSTIFKENTSLAVYTSLTTTLMMLKAMRSSRRPNVLLSDVPDLLRVFLVGDLYLGASLLAVQKPQLVRNPLVIEDVSRRALKAQQTFSDVVVRIAG